MPGTITFRPVEANLTHDTDWLGKMDPYCMFTIGTQRVKSSVCRHGGTRPHWGDTVSLNSTGLTAGTANIVRLEVFDKDRFRPDDHVAYTDIDLNEIEQRGSVARWYPLYHHRKPAGEILIEAAVQQQPVLVQSVVPTTTTYVQETVTTLPGQTIVGESYVVSGGTYTEGVPLQSGLPLGQNTGLIGGSNLGLIGGTNLGSYSNVNTTSTTYGQNTGLIGGTTHGLVSDPNLYNANTNSTLIGANPGLASKVSALGPSGGFSHGHHTLKGLTNAGYAERPGYTLGDTEANPTLQSNLDSNGGGLFNKPGRERRAEPYSLSTPGTYGIPHGQTIDTAGHIVPNVTMQRQAPIGTVTHPGITGYPDGFNTQPLAGTGLNQAGTYGTGLNSGLNQPGSYGTGLNSGLNQPGSYGTGLNSGLNTGLNQQGLQQGTYGNLINTIGQQQGVGQPGPQGSYNTGLGGNQTFGQGGNF